MKWMLLALVATCMSCSQARTSLVPPATELHPGDARTSLAVKVKRDCDQEHIQCFRDCWKYKQRDLPKHSHAHHAYCESYCLKLYMDCVKAEEAQVREFSTMEKALAWLNDHKKEVAIGAVVIVAGATFIVVTGGTGALALAPLAI